MFLFRFNHKGNRCGRKKLEKKQFLWEKIGYFGKACLALTHETAARQPKRRSKPNANCTFAALPYPDQAFCLHTL